MSKTNRDDPDEEEAAKRQAVFFNSLVEVMSAQNKVKTLGHS